MDSSRNLDNWWLPTGTLTYDLVRADSKNAHCSSLVGRVKVNRIHCERPSLAFQPTSDRWLVDAHTHETWRMKKPNERYKLSNVNHFAPKKITIFSFFSHWTFFCFSCSYLVGFSRSVRGALLMLFVCRTRREKVFFRWQKQFSLANNKTVIHRPNCLLILWSSRPAVEGCSYAC